MTFAPTGLPASQDDIDAITRAALDYVDGYTRGDADRHLNAYHPECLKRRYSVDRRSGVEELQVLSPRVMADYAAAGPPIDDCETEVVIDAISEDIASVRVYSCRWVDFLHVVKARGEWKLLHVTWHARSAE
jgi:hypothetical protein